MALVNTAFNLTRAEKPHEQRADGHEIDKTAAKGDAKNVAAPPGLKLPETTSGDGDG